MSVIPARTKLMSTFPIPALPLLAISLPMLLAPSISPTSTFLNQITSFAGVAIWLGLWAQRSSPVEAWRPRAIGMLLMLLWGALALAQGISEAPGGQRIAPVAMLLLAALAAAAAAWEAQASSAAPAITREPSEPVVSLPPLWRGLLIGLLVAGLASVLIAFVQVFKPGWTDAFWIAVSNTPGRAIGNMRQPNQLSTLLLWSCAAAVGLGVPGRWRTPSLVAVLAALVLAVVLTASRTGLVGVLLLGVWGLVDRRLPGRVRLLLLATPLIYALGWWGVEQWSAHADQAFYGDEQIRKTLHGDPSSSRGRIWANTLVMIAQHPWTGVGPGAFNFAWSMTPFPDRPVAFFDHTHNLFLQLAAESGLPFAVAIGALMLTLAVLCRSAWTQPDEARARVARCATFMLALVLLHSQLEYPLWYAYFLLPTALMTGTLVGLVPGRVTALKPADAASAPGRAIPALGLRLFCIGVSGAAMLGSGWALSEYQRVAVIFDPSVSIGPPGSLAQRISAGQRTILFGHHADYALVTMATQPGSVFSAFDRPLHHLLDTRLMQAYAQALAERGDDERARYVAARLREFRNPASAAFFAPCLIAAGALAASGALAVDPAASQPFQCGPDPKLDSSAVRP